MTETVGPSPAILTFPSNDSAASQLAALLDSAMDAVISVDESQRILIYNRAAEEIFGWPASEMRGQHLSRLIPSRFHANHLQYVSRFGSTGVTSRRMGGSSVVYGLRANGEEFPVDASISQTSTAEGRLYTVILRDVTERVQAEKAQARLAARFSGLLESAMDAIVTIDRDHRILIYNRAAERIFGWPASAVLGQPIEMLMPQRFRGGHARHVRRFEKTGVISRRLEDQIVLIGLRATGEEFPLDASVSQLDTGEETLFTVILRDVTERVRAQEELAKFAADASGVREQEKTRIARELHDELAQSLAAIKIDATWTFENFRADPDGAARKLSHMLEMLDTSVAATRRIAADLRPLLLDDLGLIPAIEWLAQNFTQRTGVPCELLLDEHAELVEPYATAAFRIVQESLANVGKHAQAQSVDVHVRIIDDELLLIVEDDGVGFATDDTRKPNSLGLLGLRERAYLLKGRVDIRTAPGEGTRIEVRMPLMPQDGREIS